MPLAYLPGNALRVRVRVAGEMRGPRADPDAARRGGQRLQQMAKLDRVEVAVPIRDKGGLI
jgi:hypothetical protein